MTNNFSTDKNLTKTANASTDGIVFNIQHYCIHDGPGIRTGVFLKGCPLRCLWCANPESQCTHPQVFWEARKCTHCGACTSICPQHALSLTQDAVQINLGACTGCGSCTKVCPTKARTMAGKHMTVDEVMKEVLEDSLFYGSDGGMTVSGGEPTMQPAFTLALLKPARAANITTAIETCGYGSWASFEALAPYCNTFLYDVKLVNPEKHLHYTKKENTRILSNLRGIAEHFPNCDIWIRTPIIPGANDSTDDILALRDLASSIPSCSQVHLLPYHNLGEGKRAQLGDPNAFFAVVPSAEHMEQLRDLLRSGNFEVR